MHGHRGLWSKSPTQYFAVTFRGLERVAADEIARIHDTHINAIPYRRVEFTARGARELIGLRTVDDVFFRVASWKDVVHTRTALHLLHEHAANTSLLKALDVCRQIRSIPDKPSVSITANFVGRRNYTTDEIKIAVAKGLERSHDWRFLVSDQEADLNVRLFIDHDIASVGARLAATPLRVRSYRTATTAATLRPPIA